MPLMKTMKRKVIELFSEYLYFINFPNKDFKDFNDTMINELCFKSGGEEGAIGWSAAPTLVERQRENLTERLKREFGLFLSDDEEERARKQGTYYTGKNTAILKKVKVFILK